MACVNVLGQTVPCGQCPDGTVITGEPGQCDPDPIDPGINDPTDPGGGWQGNFPDGCTPIVNILGQTTGCDCPDDPIGGGGGPDPTWNAPGATGYVGHSYKGGINQVGDVGARGMSVPNWQNKGYSPMSGMQQAPAFAGGSRNAMQQQTYQPMESQNWGEDKVIGNEMRGMINSPRGSWNRKSKWGRGGGY
jgi:hypothetical protein